MSLQSATTSVPAKSVTGNTSPTAGTVTVAAGDTSALLTAVHSAVQAEVQAALARVPQPPHMPSPLGAPTPVAGPGTPGTTASTSGELVCMFNGSHSWNSDGGRGPAAARCDSGPPAVWRHA